MPAPELDTVQWFNSPGPVTLQSLRGRVVVLNLWTTWYPPCRDEMPSMEALYQVHYNTAFDDSGNTALMGATLLYEMLCVLPGVMHRD